MPELSVAHCLAEEMVASFWTVLDVMDLNQHSSTVLTVVLGYTVATIVERLVPAASVRITETYLCYTIESLHIIIFSSRKLYRR